MTQPPQYPGQPEYPGQPGDPYAMPGQPPQAPPGQGWPPPPPVQDPYAVPPTSAPPTSGQPYYPPPQQPYQDPAQQYGVQPPYQDPSQQYAAPTGQFPGGPPPTGHFGPPTSQFPPPPTGQFPTGPMQGGMAPPFSGPPAPTSGFPGYQPMPPPKKNRGLTITLIVLAAVLVLCGGGGAAAYFVVKGNAGKGQTSAVEAVNGFLKAVYKDKNTDEALKFVCASSRNKEKLAQRVDDIRKYDASLSSPEYTWPTPTVDKQEGSTATLTVPVKVATSDEKVAETKYKFVATNDNGWFVCEITAA